MQPPKWGFLQRLSSLDRPRSLFFSGVKIMASDDMTPGIDLRMRIKQFCVSGTKESEAITMHGAREAAAAEPVRAASRSLMKTL